MGTTALRVSDAEVLWVPRVLLLAPNIALVVSLAQLFKIVFENLFEFDGVRGLIGVEFEILGNIRVTEGADR